MLSQIQLRSVGPAKELQLDLAPRLNVLTGDNGLGKTFVLDLAFFALTGSWPGLQALPRPGEEPSMTVVQEWRLALRGVDGFGEPRSVRRNYRFDPVLQRWLDFENPFPIYGAATGVGVSSRSKTPKDSVHLPPVLYIRVDGGFSVWDPSRNFQALPSDGEFLSPAPFHFSESTLWNGLKDGARTLCNGLIADWVSWQQRSDPQRFQALRQALTTLSPPGEPLRPGPPRRVFVDDTRDFPTIDLPHGNIPVIHASAGMRRVLGLAYAITWAWFEHLEACRLTSRQPSQSLVILFDEVETHLHPRWQRLLLPALLRVLKELKLTAQVLLTTHAPLVLASLEPAFDPEQDRLFLFEMAGEAMQVRTLDLLETRQGSASGWLTSQVFGLREDRSIEAERAIDAAEALMRGETSLPPGLASVAEIHAELLRLLPDLDPFWPRWIVHQQGRA